VVVDFELFFLDAVDSKSAEDELVARLVQFNVADSELCVGVCGWLAVKCPDGEKACRDGISCVSLTNFCDGILNCPDGSDESDRICATVCDGQFLLHGPNGFFHSKNFPHDYDSDTNCHWIIRVNDGFSIKIVFEVFQTEEEIDFLYLYEGTGPGKTLACEFIRLTLTGHMFADEEKIKCSFEDGFCYWRQDPMDDADWVRTSGSTFPPLTGPSFDHTLGNQSGFYIVTPSSPGNWEKVFRLYSLPLSSANGEICLQFWYHMYGVDVFRLAVMMERGSLSTVLFQQEGNYGDNWNYGQITLNSTIVFEARKNGGLRNDIALDDVTLTSGPCRENPYPEPTPVPLPTTPTPIRPDCGGPFDLYEPNTIFSSPNYPNGYGHNASCLWTLHAKEGQNIQLHFQDFALESAYDMVEVRDGVDPYSTLLGDYNKKGFICKDWCQTVVLETRQGECEKSQVDQKITINSGSRTGGIWVEEDVGKAESSSGRVVGGEDALKGAWPWTASLKWTGRHVCGAALIDREWLITAAHCVFGRNIHLSNWAVVLGLHAQYESDTSERQTHLVDQVIMNPRYNRRTKESDIALIHLQTKVNFTDYIQPICLPHPDQQFAPGRRCFVAGWGRMTEGGPVADVMQQAVLPLLNNSQCQEWLPEYNITKRMVCAGYAEGGVDSCQGDSGGPLMCEEEKHWVLAGVTSFGVGCARPKRPGVYALVREFIDWVVENRRFNSHWTGSR
uniref:Transmembrane serine protease 15 n=1 Tax=Astyanax mexicanus TaxID=7994 RepID=A0A8B9J7Z0_ASTMX